MLAYVHFYGDQPVMIRDILTGNHEESLEDRLERESYEANPLAFWLRPDKDEHDGPCWAIDSPYIRTIKYYDVRSMTTLVLQPRS